MKALSELTLRNREILFLIWGRLIYSLLTVQFEELMRQASKNQKAATKQLAVIEKKTSQPVNPPPSKPSVDPSFLKKVQKLPEAISSGI